MVGKFNVINTRVNPSEIFSTISQYGITVADTGFMSHIRFMMSNVRVGIIERRENHMKFLVKSNWTGNGSPITTISCKDGRLRIQYTANPLDRLSAIVFFCFFAIPSAWQLLSHGTPTAVGVLVKLIFILLIGFIPVLVIKLISLQARKETWLFLHQVIEEIEEHSSENRLPD